MGPIKTVASIDRRSVVGAAAGALAATQFGISMPVQAQAGRTPARLPVEGTMPSLTGATEWINSPPLTPAGLRGKVVLVAFWTYTCINWRRTHPYIRAWADKYKDRGLVVIGVHTPEFPFEREIENVRHEVQDMSIGYPVLVDSDYAIWRAFRNQYWPAFYFIDAQGRIRHHQFGEGEYDRSEAVLQQLLTEAGATGIGPELVAVDGQGAEAAPDLANLQTSENYVGYDRTENFSSPGGAVLGRSRLYAVPARLPVNHWALSGDWTIERGATLLNKPAGGIAYRFHARDLHLVMGASQTQPVRFRVKIDGAPLAASHGVDADAEGSGSVREPRMYQLVRQPGPIADRTFEIEFSEPGVRAYAFTFG